MYIYTHAYTYMQYDIRKKIKIKHIHKDSTQQPFFS